MIYYSEKIANKINKGGRHWLDSGENQTQDSKSPSPMESHWTCLSPPAVSCNNMGKMLTMREAHWRLSAQGFCWRVTTQTPA